MLLDVLIITALYDELQAILELGEGRAAWKDERDSAGFLYHSRVFHLGGSEDLRVAAAWSGAMGETAAANRAQHLISALQPLALAMCGICAGRRGDVFLGDVIVANRVFSYDHGKLIASTQGGHRVEELFHDIETYNLEKAWAMDAAYFAPEKEWQETLRAQRPRSLGSQRGWLLRTLYEHRVEGGSPPQNHPERPRYCPDWTKALASLRKDRLVVLTKGQLEITTKGRNRVLEERVQYVDGVPPDPPFRVHIGPMATGKTVRQDPELFQRLARFERNALGLEMESAAIGFVAEQSGIPSIIAKAVSDYGDANKDDNFRQFACRASAEFLLAFLSKYPPRLLKRNRALSLSGNELNALPRQVAAEVLNSLLAAGLPLNPPKGSPGNSLFYCETQDGHRAIGVALNNSGLIAYVGPKEIHRAVNINQKQEYEITHLETGNEFIHFATLDGPTQGLTPSYLHQMDVDSGVVWTAFNRAGKPIPLKVDAISNSMSVYTGERDVWLDEVILAKAEASADKVMGGPVLTENNELFGFVFAGSGGGKTEEQFIVIWPWISLNNALMEAQELLPQGAPALPPTSSTAPSSSP